MGLEAGARPKWRDMLGVQDSPDDLELCIIFFRGLQLLAGHDYTAQRVGA